MRRDFRTLLVPLLLLVLLPIPAYAQGSAFMCFWSAEGPVCVERGGVSAAGLDPEGALVALLAGPTPQERAQGLWSAIPEGTTLARIDTLPDGTVVVRLDVPTGALAPLDPLTLEIIVQQIGGTLEPLQWRDLQIQTWDPSAQQFVPLADFLPDFLAPRKETVLTGEETALTAFAAPPAGEGLPQGALTGKTVYVSAGHGWQWNGYAWRVQRIPYPRPPYVGPIIEDHNNAEAVNQYLLQYLWNAGAMVVPVRERDMNSAEVIVDNDAPGSGAGYSETGVWTTGIHDGYLGLTYRHAESVTDAATATAVWTARLPADGRYAVYVWYQPGSNRAPDARYTVHHAGGDTTFTVDQRHHGGAWHYIGTYGFQAGEEARITLDNHSSVAGAVVIADAVRFGGGMFSGLTGIDTTATSAPNVPWWEVAAYYQVQRMGMSPSNWPYFNDIVARPMYARWEHAGSGDDAVYVSWHTNGTSGYQTTARGTVSIIHNGEGNPVTPGSAELRDVIHKELVHDIQVGWDPTWSGSTRSMDLGELRELWDPDYPLPGALIEIAYHDNPRDADALKEPAFEMLAARAIYQGIVKYFEQRGGVDLTLLPEPPTHLAVENVGGGQVQVSWRLSPFDTLGLAGDPATGYRVYTSANGVGWSNGVSVPLTTIYTLTGLAPGQLLFVRVTATNAGGESLPTETLAVRVGDARVIVVNGFDRLNQSLLVSDYYAPTDETDLRMFLDRMNSRDYVIQHATVIAYPFDSASNEAVQVGRVNLSDYALADWILGEESTQDETLNGTEQALLSSFLGGGGALLISGSEIGYDLDHMGSASDRAFYNGILRARYAGDNADTYAVAPASGSIFAGLSPFRFDAPGMYDPRYPDQIASLNGSVAALTYQGGAGGVAAVQYANGCERLVYLCFPFETIWPDQRLAVMGRILSFLDECLSMPVVDTYRFYMPLAMQSVAETPLPPSPTPTPTPSPTPPPSPPPACSDVIINGGFETAGGWALNSRAVYDTARFHTGTQSARVGIPPGEPGVYAYSSISQTITLPAGSAATLRLWVYPISEGLDLGDQHYVSLYDQRGGYQTVDATTSDDRAWVQREYDLSAYMGQTIRLFIGAKNDGDDNTAALYVDDVTLEVCP